MVMWYYLIVGATLKNGLLKTVQYEEYCSLVIIKSKLQIGYFLYNIVWASHQMVVTYTHAYK